MFGIALLIHRSVRNVHEMVFRRLWEGYSEQRKFVLLLFRVNVFLVHLFDRIFTVLIGEFEDSESNVSCEL